MRFRYFTFTFVIVLSVWSGPLYAECATLTLPDEFARSASVFLGRVAAQSVVTVPKPWRVETETAFEVEQSWKGSIDNQKKVRVRTCGGIVGDESINCGEAFRFDVGSRYLVFADGQPLTTNTCHHTAKVEGAEPTLQWLSTKPSRKVQ